MNANIRFREWREDFAKSLGLVEDMQRLLALTLLERSSILARIEAIGRTPWPEFNSTAVHLAELGHFIAQGMSNREIAQHLGIRPAELDRGYKKMLTKWRA
jgi:hypothetical protein